MVGPAPASLVKIFSPIQPRSVAERFIVALITGALAVLLRRFLDPLLGDVALYVTVYMAVAFSALVCGFLPAALTATIGFLGTFYWFVGPIIGS